MLEQIFGIPVDYGWVIMSSKVSNADWSKYSNVDIFVKGTGEPSRLEFSIQEADGDAWYFFDEGMLKTKDWVSISMPFENFVHPPWAHFGDGEKEFKNVTMFQLTITSFDRAVNNTLYFALEGNNLIRLA